MQNPGNIRYLRHEEIDKAKWDHVVAESPEGSIYGCSWMLDAAAGKWDALVSGDYDTIVPLPVRKKWGITYVFQPYFIQCLPLMGKKALSANDVSLLFTHIAGRFKWVFANFSHTPQPAIKAAVRKRVNFILPIPAKADDLLYRKKKDVKQNLRKTKGLYLKEGVPPAMVADMFYEVYGRKYYAGGRKITGNLTNLLTSAIQRESGQCYGVANAQDEIIFSAAVLHFSNRLVYLVSAPTGEGRIKSAAHFFIDEMISRHMNKGLIFDFEGSDIPSVAGFYRKFNPQDEFYYEVKINNLSWPWRLFKK